MAIVSVLFALFYFVGQKSSNQVPESKLSSSNTSNENVTDTDLLANSDTSFLATLEYIKSMQIDASLFLSSSFKALEDNTVIIESNRFSGRTNPFSPIPGSVRILLDTDNEGINTETVNN